MSKVKHIILDQIPSDGGEMIVPLSALKKFIYPSRLHLADEPGHFCTCAEDIAVNGSNRYDPTRTITLRNIFVRAMNVRFNKVIRKIRQAIVERDCFGLNPNPTPTIFQDLPAHRAFEFLTSQEKIEAFMVWLREQIDNDILQVGQVRQLGSALRKEWTDMYIEDSYKRGIIRSRYEMIRAGYDIPTLLATGGILGSLYNPFHMDRLGILYARVFSDLKGITSAMDAQISRVLAQGMADGDGMMLLARKLVQVVNGTGGELGIKDTLGRWIPAKRRAQTLARTEIVRAHHMATIQEYRNWGVVGVHVQAEWRTAGDDNVCSLCQPYHGKTFTLDEIEPMIPVHPNCRCMALPLLVETKNKT